MKPLSLMSFIKLLQVSLNVGFWIQALSWRKRQDALNLNQTCDPVTPHTFDIAPNLPGQRWCLRIYRKSLRRCFKIELMSSSIVFKLLTCFQEHTTTLIQEPEETQDESLEEWYLLVTWQSWYLIRLTGRCCSWCRNIDRYCCCPLACPNNSVIYSFSFIT